MTTGQLPDASWWQSNPWARMSFSRLAAYRRCPAWYRFTSLDWHASATGPEQEAGHVVQDVLQRVFDGNPASDVSAADLGERAHARGARLLEKAWDEATRAFAENPNAIGDFAALDRANYAGFIRRGLDFHLREVHAWLSDRHPRSGKRVGLPAFGAVIDAWTGTRPWHAPASSSEGEPALEVIPQGWFQGQYDLVYEWTGGRRIVDLKASTGTSIFSPEISEQLLSYTFMERALGRGSPEGLEAWFLGKEEPMLFPVPDENATNAWAEGVRALLVKSGVGGPRPDPEAFAPHPEQPAGRSASPGAASAWCSVCPAAYGCPLSGKKAPSAGQGVALTPILPKGRGLSIEGIVLGMKGARMERGKQKRRITFANESGVASFKWDESDCQDMFARGLRAGAVVRVTGLNSWSPENAPEQVFYFTSPKTTAEVLAESWGDSARR
jgi:hypothetical protein